jgi:hypothetical protein
VLGGSFGIAASTAILGVIKNRELGDIISPAQLAVLQISTLSTTQAEAVRLAYAHAFSHTMRISTIISGISILLAALSYQKEPLTHEVRVEQQRAVEDARRRSIAAQKRSEKL